VKSKTTRFQILRLKKTKAMFSCLVNTKYRNI